MTKLTLQKEHAGLVAVWCRCFDSIMFSKKDEPWGRLVDLEHVVNDCRNTDVVSAEDRELALENERLRREVRILKEEKGILKYRYGSQPACAPYKQPVLPRWPSGWLPIAYWRVRPVKRRGT